MKNIHQAIATQSYLLGLRAPDLETALGEVVRLCVDRGLVPEDRADTLLDHLVRREREASSALGDSVAVPHAYFDFLPRQVLVFVRLEDPLPLGAPDGVPTRFLFVLFGRQGHAEEHLETLKVIARLMSDHELRYELGIAEDQDQLLEALRHFEERSAPPPPELAPAEARLRRTGRPFGGLIDDIRRRFPHYRDDLRDGLHPKALGSTLFLFFACLAPAITFGGFMSAVTGGSIGAVEMLMATAVCGVIYALLSGQPLIILGGTGPMLVMTEVLYILCLRFDLPFLPVYAWVGLWSAALLIILAAADASSLIRYFTRFTDEIFAALISTIFIVEAVDKLLDSFNGEGEAALASGLLSLLLALGTFYMAMSLSRFRKSRFLHSKMREFLADFGPTIAVATMAGVAYFFFYDVELQPLEAPEDFGPTSGRSWTIDLFAVPSWVILAALAPALLSTILIFLDQNITARIIQSPDHKLERGSSYHLDLGLVGVLIGACSVFGLPWLVAATVRSLNHLRSLATTEEIDTGGARRDRIIHVRENRVTGVAIHLLIGASLVLLPYVRLIPMPVLYGLFLFMGVVSMSGNQFFERLSLWLMDANRYPITHYTRRVPGSIIHAFTALQAICLAVLWLIKVSVLGILFPLFIALLVPIRMVLASRWFRKEHLAALDAEEDPDAPEGQ